MDLLPCISGSKKYFICENPVKTLNLTIRQCIPLPDFSQTPKDATIFRHSETKYSNWKGRSKIRTTFEQLVILTINMVHAA